ncbi:MAG: P1 family peptidase [Bacteroidetes bacterium]|nr:P1 family peptidase [Bacteroidota bacterium]
MFGFDTLHVGTTEDLEGITGCTAIIFEGGARASADVRGASPGTRELALLAPDKQMDRIDGIMLTGGSAYGLAAATGAMRFLSEHGMGYKTPWRVVPIVPSAVIFDLNIGSPDGFPDDQMGYLACAAAMKDEFRKGSHGAGTGATVGKWAGIENAMKSGQGVGIVEAEGIRVVALAVTNAVGDVIDDSGHVLAGAIAGGKFVADTPRESERIPKRVLPGANTTLVAVVSNVDLTKIELNRVAQRSHDALAKRIMPVHTSYDGDTVFAVSAGNVNAPLDLVASLAVDAVSDAIIDAVKSAQSLGGFPSYSDLHK